MRGRRRPDGAPGRPGPGLVAGACLLLAGVLLVRPGTAVEGPTDRVAWDLESVARSGAVLRADDPAGEAPEASDTVLRRGGAASIALGQGVADLERQGWRASGPAACEELVRPGDDAGLRGWASGGRVVAVRLDAPTTPGLLLPTAVRTGWSVEAVLAGSDGLLRPRTVTGPAGRRATVLIGRLPVGTWPPETAPAPARGDRPAVAPEPVAPAVDLVLADGGTGHVVSAEVRVPAAAGCRGAPGEP